MRKSISSLMTIGVLAAGSLLATAAPAAAKAYCERSSQPPTFYGSTMDAYYSVTCSRNVSQSKLTGRLKEDKNSAPDIVHVTTWIYFTGTKGAHATRNSCQNGDLIYSEAQIDSEPPSNSSRREMNC